MREIDIVNYKLVFLKVNKYSNEFHYKNIHIIQTDNFN